MGHPNIAVCIVNLDISAYWPQPHTEKIIKFGVYQHSSAAKPGTHFLENNKITALFTMLKLCVIKE